MPKVKKKMNVELAKGEQALVRLRGSNVQSRHGVIELKKEPGILNPLI